MLDTIRLEIPLKQLEIELVKFRLSTVSTIDNSSGEVVKEFFKGSLSGSWDSRISCIIKDTKWETVETEQEQAFEMVSGTSVNCFGRKKITSTHKFQKNKKVAVQVACSPYLLIEFSLAKWAYGVNLQNSSILQDALALSLFRYWISSYMGFEFPSLDVWRVRRVDCAFNYMVGEQKNVIDMITYFRLLKYQRRKQPNNYHNTFYVPGTITTLKLYSKYDEFKAHDYKRFRNDMHLADSLYGLAYGTLRYEVEFKKRILDKLKVNFASDIFKIDWDDLMKKEIKKVIHGATTTKAYKIHEVQEILANSNLSGSGCTKETVLSVWLVVSTQGRTEANKAFGFKKVSRAMAVLERLSIPCISTIQETTSTIPDECHITFDHFRTTDYDRHLCNTLDKILPFDHTLIDRARAFTGLNLFPLPRIE